MKKILIRNLVICLILMMSFSILALADDMNMSKGNTKSVDGINVELSFNKDKVEKGNNDIMITLKDSNGQAISNATVKATAEMDKSMDMNMNDTKPVAIAFKSGDEMGQYMGKVNFTDKGKWIVKAVVNVQGQQKNMDFDVNVTGGGASYGLIGGFLGVMALIIIAAAIKKQQTAKA